MNIQLTNPAKCDAFSLMFINMRLFTSSINIMFEKDRLFIQAMDSSRISILEIHLPAKWFDTYELSNSSSIVLGVNTIILSKVLSTREKTQNITMKHSNNESDKLCLEFTSDSKTVFDKFFEIPLIDIDEELMSIPETDYQAEFSLSSSNFASLMTQMKLFGDTLQIECSEEKIQMGAVSQDVGKMNVTIPIDDLTSFAIEEGGSLDLSFSLTHLISMCTYSKLAKDLEICISDNYPIRLTYNLGDPESKFVFYLAPKINDA